MIEKLSYGKVNDYQLHVWIIDPRKYSELELFIIIQVHQEALKLQTAESN